MKLSVEQANANDCSQIRSLAARVWEHTYRAILPAEQLGYMFEMMYSIEHIRQQMDEGQQYFILRAGGHPSGYLSIERADEDTFIFQKIYILPELQGQGVGRYLFEQGVDRIKTIHPTPFTLRLYVNRLNPAVGFYERLGMQKTATRDHPIGNGYYMNDYIMTMEV